MNAGTLDRRITIQSPAPQNSFTSTSGTWTDVLICWASIHTATGREVFAASGYVSQLSHVITIRYTTTAIKTSYRVQYGTRVFLVQGVSDPTEGREQINLLCLEQGS